MYFIVHCFYRISISVDDHNVLIHSRYRLLAKPLSLTHLLVTAFTLLYLSISLKASFQEVLTIPWHYSNAFSSYSHPSLQIFFCFFLLYSCALHKWIRFVFTPPIPFPGRVLSVNYIEINERGQIYLAS